MSEKEIRSALHEFMADLERHSRQVVRQGVRKVVLPAVLGTGLALSGCSDDTDPPPKSDTIQSDGVQVKDGGKDCTVTEAGILYMAPDVGPAKDCTVTEAGILYMAPDAGPAKDCTVTEAGILYMAPDAATK